MNLGGFLRKSTVYLSILLIILCFNTAFSQGDFLEEGQSGYQLVGAFTKSANEYGVSANLGYSIDGAFDLGFSIGRLSVGEGILSCTYYGSNLIFHTNKQGAGKFPISISYFIQYVFSSYSRNSLAFFENDIEMTGNHVKLGMALFYNIKVDPVFIVQPNVLIGYSNNNIDISQRSYTEQIVSNKGMNFGLGFSMLIGKPTKSGIRIDTGFSIYNNETAFSISLGIIKATNESKRDW